MKLLVRPSTLSPSAAIRFILQTGSVHDPAGKEGLALATGLMLEEGTRRRSGREISERIDFLGAETEASVDKHSTVLAASVLEGDVGEILSLFAEAASVPVFPRKELEKVKGQLATSIREEKHDTRALAIRSLVRLLYPVRHPYRRAGGGTEASIRSLNRGDLVRFHEARYHPNGAILVLVGDVDPAKIRRIVGRTFGAWRKRGEPGPPAVPAASGPRRPAVRTVVVPEKTQSDIALGFVGIRRTDPEFHQVTVMNQIFGAFGLGGRIGNRVREKEGLAYYAHSALTASVGAGPFVVRAGVHPDHVERAVRIIREEIERIIRHLVSRRELQETKDFLIGSLPLRLETHDGLASFLLAEEYYGLGPDYRKRYRKEIAAVTREEVREAARRIFRLEAACLAVAGPPLPRPLRGPFGRGGAGVDSARGGR
jgi:zinc protease